MPARRLNQSLLHRLALYVAVLIFGTTVLLGLSSASGVYDMARREQSARQRAYRDVIIGEMESRLAMAERITGIVGEGAPSREPDTSRIANALSATLAEYAEIIDGWYVIDPDGRVVVAASSGDSTVPQARLLASSALAAARADTYVLEGTEGDTRELWVALPVRYRGYGSRIVCARIRTAFIDRVLTDVVASSPGTLALVLGVNENVRFAAGDEDVSAGLTFEFDDTGEVGDGAVIARALDGTTYVGTYATVGGAGGIGWKVAVLEPSGYAMREAWSALRPAIATWSIIAVASLLAAVGIVSWVVHPLREMERRASAAARGALVRPLQVDRADEIGSLMRAFNSLASRLNRLYDVTQVLARSSELDEVLDGIVTSVQHMIPAADVGVLVPAEDGDRLELVRAAGGLAASQGLTFSIGESAWLADAFRRGMPVEYAEGDTPDPLITALGDPHAYGLAVPLSVGAERLGAIVALLPAGGSLDDAEVEMVRWFAAQSSMAVHNSRLFAEERRSRREAEMLREVAEHLARPTDVEAALEEAAGYLTAVLGMSSSLVAISDREEYGLAASPNQERDAAAVATWRERYGRSWDEPVLLPRAGASPFASIAAALDAESLFIAPLCRGPEVDGLIVCGSRLSEVHLSPRQTAVAAIIAAQASLALDNAHLFAEVQARADNLETVFRISQAVSSSLQVKVVLNRVLDVVQKILSADAVVLMTLDSDKRYLSVPMARGKLHRGLLEMRITPGQDVPGAVFESKEPELYSAIDTLDTPLTRAAAEQGLSSMLVVPLLARGRSIGVLVVLGQAEGAFDTSDLELLRTFATQAALAIDTAELFSREHRVATVLQESILPTRLPQLPGIDSSSVYLPAGTEAEIGGDYYDLFPAPDGRVVLAMGDVCGKGVVAATKTSMIKYLIRGMVTAGLSPAEVLRELNESLAESEEPTDIVTLWIGLLDVESGVLSYGNGGHPAGLLLRPSDGEIVRLTTTGALLGAVRGTEYVEETVEVEPDALLLLYTDGVTEARNKDRFFGEGRVRRALKRGGSPAAVVQRLLSLVERFSGGSLRDDAAILAVRRIPR